MARRFSNIDLIDQCDAFPNAVTAKEQYAAHMASLVTVTWADGGAAEESYPLGYMRRNVFEELVKIPRDARAAMGLDGDLDLASTAASTGTLPLHRLLGRQADEAGRTRAMDALARYWRQRQTFRLLGSWRDEMWPVYGRGGRLLFSMERGAMGLLGTTRYGVHLTVYEGDGDELRIWVPKRAADKSTYPGMLDNTVAGGLMTGEDPFECLVREADEEASLPAAVVRQHTRAVGAIGYLFITDERAGGEPGYVYPECEWVYDLQLPPPGSSGAVAPQPKDGEVESFQLCTVAEVCDQLAQGLYKPNCAVVMLDFLVRHGFLTPDRDDAYPAIVARLHRVLPFPGPHQADEATAQAAAEAAEAVKAATEQAQKA